MTNNDFLSEFSEKQKEIKNQISNVNPVKGWKKESNNGLKKQGSWNRVVDTRWIYFMGIFGMILIALISAGFFYLGFTDHYKDNYNVSINPLFNATINEDILIENSYDFNPNTENDYHTNVTIINNVECPP